TGRPSHLAFGSNMIALVGERKSLCAQYRRRPAKCKEKGYCVELEGEAPAKLLPRLGGSGSGDFVLQQTCFREVVLGSPAVRFPQPLDLSRVVPPVPCVIAKRGIQNDHALALGMVKRARELLGC